jgi:hypothetical protein
VGFDRATSGNDVMTSSDGVIWTSRSTPVFAPWTDPEDSSRTVYGRWNSVTWSPELALFVAVGQNYNNDPGTEVMTSSDGVTWTARTASSDNRWDSVVWSPELGIFTAVGNGNAVMNSSNGIDWTETHAGGSDWTSVAWSSSLHLFVAVSEAITDITVMTSRDGVDWSTQAGLPTRYVWNSIAWSPELGIFSAVGSNNVFMTSSDGLAWTSVAPPSNKVWSSIAWSPQLGMFAAVANSAVDKNAATSEVATPVISAVSSGTPDATAATITWVTDISADTQVHYGPTADYATSTILDPTLTVSHSASLGGLARCTEYHYQVSSVYAGKGANSDDNIFTTAGCVTLPTVTTVDSSQLTSDGATLQGSIDTLGGTPIVTRGFQLSLNEFFEEPFVISETSEGFPAGPFTLYADDLHCDTLYYYRAYASDSNGAVVYGEDKTFTTASCESPNVLGAFSTQVETTTATLGATVSDTGGSDISSRGFHYGPTDAYGETTIENGTFSVGPFSISLSGLSPDTTYHYRAYAVNGSGTGMSDADMTFTTKKITGSSGGASSGGGGGEADSSPAVYQRQYGKPAPVAEEKTPVILFTRTLRKGMKTEDVMLLQRFLNTHGYSLAASGAGSPGEETNFFGGLTWDAVYKFQNAYAKEILEPLFLDGPTGFFGPYTLKIANEILVKESSGIK